jgi:dTDP-4-dehydrorhamnose reductase
VNVVVIGGNGQLGIDIASTFANRGDAVVSLTHADIELSSLESVRRSLDMLPADVVVNTAAMHHVEHCEKQPEEAFAVNAIGARNLALVTHELRMVLVHISTDYVFDGAKGEPYTEDDTPLPLNIYGNSKLAGEHFVRAVNPRHFVLRTSALYGKHPCRAKGGQNFVELMLRLARERGSVRVVDDEFVSPTSTTDLARQVVALSGCDQFGLYHATGEGSCSWYQYAKEIFALAKVNVQVEVARSSEFPLKVARPHYSVLENRALKDIGLNRFRPWQGALASYLCSTEVLCESECP